MGKHCPDKMPSTTLGVRQVSKQTETTQKNERQKKNEEELMLQVDGLLA